MNKKSIESSGFASVLFCNRRGAEAPSPFWAEPF